VEDLCGPGVRGERKHRLAQYGIIYLDEVDKIAASSSLVRPDVSRSGVQRALLNPWKRRKWN